MLTARIRIGLQEALALVMRKRVSGKDKSSGTGQAGRNYWMRVREATTQGMTRGGRQRWGFALLTPRLDDSSRPAQRLLSLLSAVPIAAECDSRRMPVAAAARKCIPSWVDCLFSLATWYIFWLDSGLKQVVTIVRRCGYEAGRR